MLMAGVYLFEINPIYYYGSEEQKKKYLPDLCKGKCLLGFGLTEPNAGSDAGGTETVAKKDGNEWVINGSKIFITNSSTPMSLGTIVQAVTGERPNGKKEYTCFVVEEGTNGYKAQEMKGKLMWRASNTAELCFEDCRVP